MDRRYSAAIITLGIVFITAALCSYPHYTKTAVFTALGSLLLLVAVLTDRRFAQLVTAVSPTPWTPNSLRGWFGVVMFGIAVTGIAVVIIFETLVCRST